MMVRKTGFIAGLVLAAIGIVVGVIRAWTWFGATPHDATDFGLFFGLMAALVGCACGAIGALAGRQLRAGRSD
jgi:hypothetical protein